MAEEDSKKSVLPRPDVLFDPRDVQAKNVSGSTAGAGSGDFHVYRQQRRRELDRIQSMERAAKEAAEKEKILADAGARRLKEENRTAKRAQKRKRKKELAIARKKERQSEGRGAQNQMLGAGVASIENECTKTETCESNE